jgi:hypothetical protein
MHFIRKYRGPASESNNVRKVMYTMTRNAKLTEADSQIYIKDKIFSIIH